VPRFKLSQDPTLSAKLRDAVGRCYGPPDHTLAAGAAKSRKFIPLFTRRGTANSYPSLQGGVDRSQQAFP
jgi:hypothetical protein